MPQDPNQSSPNWRGGKGKIERKAKKQEWQQSGQPIVSTDGMGRRLRLAGYFLGVIVCVLGIAGLIWMLRKPTPPLVVIVANAPEQDALRTDVPLDFYGWKGAEALGKWIAAAREKEDPGFLGKFINLRTVPTLVDDSPKPMPLTRDAKALVDKIVRSAKDTKYVLIYFGVLGTVDDEGNPCLFIAGGGTLTIKELLTELKASALAETKILLCFDAARLQYSPRLGILHNDFARKLEDVFKAANAKNIAIISSSDVNELAWDSDQAGKSVFLLHLLQTLEGKDTITAQDLYDQVKSQTEAWTSQRFITRQTPKLIHDAGSLKEWKWPRLDVQYRKDHRKDDKVVSFLTDTAVVTKIQQAHDKAVKLAQLKPGPEVYVPLHWRYYRELLLRLEKAVLAQDDLCASRLANQLAIVDDEIRKGHAIPPGEAYQTTLTMQELLQNTAVKEIKEPAERQFKTMLDGFKAAGGELDLTLKNQAWEVRRLAERSALAMISAEKLYPYSERLWPLIQGQIAEADTLRRQGEDLVFASGKAEQAKLLLDQAGKKYQEATTGVESLQKAWHTYHRAASLLPELLEWRTSQAVLDNEKAKATTTHVKQCQGCIESFVLLENMLKSIQPKSLKEAKDQLQPQTANLDKKLADLLTEYRKVLEEVPLSIEQKFKKDVACSIPFLVDADQPKPFPRFDALQKARKVGDDNYAVNNAKSRDPLVIAHKTLVEQRLGLITQLLKPEEVADLASLDLDKLVKQGIETRKQWLKLQRELKDSKNLADLLTLEGYSRLALYEPKAIEPAIQLRQMQWKAVLQGQALRFAFDHWYDSDQTPYYRKLVEACLKDAATQPEGDVKALLEAPSIQLQAAKSNVVWTSEQDQTLLFTLKRLPGVLKGFVTTWPELPATEKPVLQFKPSFIATPRQVREVKQESTETLLLPVELASQDTDGGPPKIPVTQYAYFRGQEQKQDVNIELSRQPSRVITWQKPTAPASFVVNSTGDLGIGLGHLAIVLDYSGSMLWHDDRKEDIKWSEGEAAREGTRIRAAIRTLESILEKLPNETQLSIYVFSDRISSAHLENITNFESSRWGEFTRATKCRSVITGTITGSGNALKIKTKSGSTIDKAELVKSLKDLEPRGFTPLIQSMDFCISDALQSNEVSTLLVLTDGMDTSEGNLLDPKVMNDEQKSTAIQKLASKFEQMVRGSVTTIHMVFFQAAPEEMSICNQVFDVSKKDQISYRVKIHSAKNTDQLKDALVDALRPRVRLLKNGQPVLDNKYGLEVSKAGTPIHEMVCSPAIAPGKYELTVGTDKSTTASHQGQLVRFDPAEFMFLELSPATKPGQVQIKRKLFKDVFFDEKKAEEKQYVLRDSTKAPWHVCLAENHEQTVDGQKFRTMRFTLEHGIALEAEGGQLQLNPPSRHAWWEVEYRDTNNKPLARQPRTQVGNVLPRYFAPAWDVQMEPPPSDAAQIYLHIWPEENQEQTLAALSINKAKKSEPLKHGEYLVRCFHVNDYRPYDAGFSRMKEKTPALAIQVQLPVDLAPQRLQLELQGMQTSAVDHLYYGPARTVTAYFLDITLEQFEKLDETVLVKFITLKPEPPITWVLTRPQVVRDVTGNTILNFATSKK